MQKKQIVKRLVTGILGACLGLSSIPVWAQEVEGTAMGRYVETELSQPENPEEMMVIGITCMVDNRLRILTRNLEEKLELWDSRDGGESWELASSLPTEYGKFYIMDISLAPDGGGAAVGMIESGSWKGGDPQSGVEAPGEEENAIETEEAGDVSSGEEDAWDYEYYYISFDGEGNAKATLLPEGQIHLIRITREGQVLGMSYSGAVWILDRDTGEIRQELPSAASMIGVCGKEGLILTDTEVLRYDMSNGEPLDRDEALNSALYSGGEYYGDISDTGHAIVFTEDEEGRLYYCTRNGIYSHVMGGSAVEQIVDGTLCSLSDISIQICAMTIADGNFYLVYCSKGQTGLMKYTYDPGIVSVPERELTIYSLFEDSGIRQAAVHFQKDHPDTYINYEIGISGEDGVTVSDALRTLNTDILAGNGPDILLLDELSVDTYAGKGMLTDLSGILQEISAREGLWENIALAYQDKEAVCAVPARFGIAVAAGEVSALNRLENLDSLAELAGEEGTLNFGEMACLPLTLYYSCAGSWKEEDGTIDQERLAEYVTGLKQIYDNWSSQATEEEKEYCLQNLNNLSDISGSSGYFAGSVGGSELGILGGWDKLAVGILLNVIDYAGYTSVNQITGSCSVLLFGGQQEKVFVPLCTLGILNTAREPERAADFVKYMLSSEGQLAVETVGFPVNKTAFEAALADESWSGKYSVSSGFSDGSGYVELTYYQSGEEERKWLTNAVASLTACSEREQVQKETVLADTLRCITGEVSAEEAVNSIVQKLNLYLAENQ